MIDLLRPFVGRVIAAWIAALSGWLASTVGVEIAPEDQAAVINAGVGIALTVYAVLHRMIDARINPRDAASPTVAAADHEVTT